MRITVTMQMVRLPIALESMDRTYRLWNQWKDINHPQARKHSLIAKTRGLIAYDHIMCMEERP
jgi:hypothetical protein